MNYMKNLLNNVKESLSTKNDNYKGDFIPPSEEPNIPIDINKQIRTKYQKGWINKIRKAPIKEIVIHGTAGGNTTEGLLKWMFNGARAKNYYKGISLFHYLIDKDGGITEVLDPNYWVWHSSSGNHDKETIGIELINSSKSNRDPYTEKQIEALNILIFDYLMKLYPTITQIASHRYNRMTYSKLPDNYLCPGAGYDWDALDTELRSRELFFKTEGDLRYDIGPE